MTDAQEEKPLTKEQAIRHYQVLKYESQQLMRQVRELDSQRNEHRLVIEALVRLPSERRCYRMIGGVLVERTVGEVIPAITGNVEKIEETNMAMMERLKAKDAEALDFQIKHNIRVQANDVAMDGKRDAEQNTANTGVLA
eukprot:c9646_g1_i1.p1 GENE.c9646_g1_i1~~c9646_g1_i1.p1  ORF type:complete len:157 (-),score=44.98 c9646_g1_i1:123-542(-)